MYHFWHHTYHCVDGWLDFVWVGENIFTVSLTNSPTSISTRLSCCVPCRYSAIALSPRAPRPVLSWEGMGRDKEQKCLAGWDKHWRNAGRDGSLVVPRGSALFCVPIDRICFYWLQVNMLYDFYCANITVRDSSYSQLLVYLFISSWFARKKVIKLNVNSCHNSSIKSKSPSLSIQFLDCIHCSSYDYPLHSHPTADNNSQIDTAHSMDNLIDLCISADLPMCKRAWE
jgi:hypothetical protein